MKLKYLIPFLVCLVIIRIGIILHLDLIPDEAYYWSWSRHLQGGYFDHPPMVALLIHISTWLGSHTEFWVRLPAFSLGLGLSLIAFIFGREFFEGKNAGYEAVFWINVILIFALGFIVITPDTPLVFFSALTLLFFQRAIFQNRKLYWYASGLALGCGLMSKYTAILLIPCLLLFLGFSNRYRFWLRQKEPFLSLILAIFVFSPVLIWNAQHGWNSFKFQLSHGFSGNPSQGFLNAFEFFGSQILVMTPFVFAALYVASYYGYRIWVTEKNDRWLFLFTFSVPIFLFFFMVSFKNKVEGNWPVLAYFPAIMALSGVSSRMKKNFYSFKTAHHALNRWAVITASILVMGTHLQAGISVLPLTPKQDLALKRAAGWKLLGQYVGTHFHSPTNPKGTFIFSHRHNIVGELAFYLPGQPETYRSHGTRRYSFLGNLDHLIGQDGLYVLQDGSDELNEFQHHFRSVVELSPLIIHAKGHIIRTFRLFRCRFYQGGLIEV